MPQDGPRVSDLGFVFLGGAVGATARVALAVAFPVDRGSFPWTTFVENVVGAFLLALLVTVLVRKAIRDRRIHLAVGTGALGAFTTYSTFAVELDHLLRDGGVWVAIVYATASLVLGVLAATGGLLLGRRITTHGHDPDDGNAEVAR